MAVTGQTIRDALSAVGAVGKQIKSFDELAAGADGALRQAPGLTPVGAACFLATMAQESAYFRTCEEYGKKLRYDPFRGRTFEMLTWEGNYGNFGIWLNRRGLLADPNQFKRDPRSLADIRWAWLGGVWFFEANAVWRYANPGDFLRVSQAVNGGQGMVGTKRMPNGWDHRRKMFDAFNRMGPSLLPGGAPAPAPPAGPQSLPSLEYGMRNHPAVASLQRWSNAFPWRPALPLLEPQGNYLDQTVGVIRAAQLQMGVRGGDGRNIGPQTKDALWRLGWRG